MSPKNKKKQGPFCVTSLDWGKQANRLQAMGTAKWVQRKAENCSARQPGKDAKQTEESQTKPWAVPSVEPGNGIKG